MRKSIYLLVLAVLAVSCYEEIVIPVGDDEAVGVMNAQLNTLDSVHTVQLSVSQKSDVKGLTGADVRVFVNGTLVATAKEIVPLNPDITYWDGYRSHQGPKETDYTFEAEFRPGDEVRIEARKGEIELSSTLTVPAATHLSSVDTSTVQMTYMGDKSTYLQAKMVFNDLPGLSFYRLSGRIVEDVAYLDESGEPAPGLSGTTENVMSLETGFDPIISEGTGKTGGADIGALLKAENSYHCFADTPFSGEECTIRPLVFFSHLSDGYYWYYPDFLDNIENPDWAAIDAMDRRVQRRWIIQLRSLDFGQYHYIKALEHLDTFGEDMSFLVEPTTLPSNVEGGLGFVGMETVTEYTFCEETCVLPGSDGIVYYGGGYYED